MTCLVGHESRAATFSVISDDLTPLGVVPLNRAGLILAGETSKDAFMRRRQSLV